MYASGVSSWRSRWQGARWLYGAVGWTCKPRSGGSEGAEQCSSCLRVAEQRKAASLSLAELQRQPRRPDSGDPAQPPDFPAPCSPNGQHPFTNPSKALLPGKRQWQGFKCDPHLLPSICCHVVLVVTSHPQCRSSYKRRFLFPATENRGHEHKVCNRRCPGAGRATCSAAELQRLCL